MNTLEQLKTAVRGKRLLLLGPSGSGKGNRSRDLEALGLMHVGLGAMMREHVRSDPDSELSLRIIETTKSGTLLPDDVVAPIVLEYLDRKECKERGFVLEGFPRTKAQADLLLSRVDIDIVFLLQVPRAFLVDGIMKFNRRSCIECGTTYSDFDMPEREGVCDRCGNELIRRMSDSLERVRNRLKTYEDEIETFLSDFEAKGIVQELHITVGDDKIIDDKYCKKLKGEVFLVETDDGRKARMLNYDGMRIRLYRVLEERFGIE
jgi:adenylate kinase